MWWSKKLHHTTTPSHHYFFLAAGAAAFAPAAGAAPLAPVAAGAAPFVPAAGAAAGAAPFPAAAAPAAGAAPVAAAPSTGSSFTAFTSAIFRCATFGNPKTLFFSLHFSSSASFSKRSVRVRTLRCRTSALAPFKLRSKDMSHLDLCFVSIRAAARVTRSVRSADDSQVPRVSQLALPG